MEIYARDPAKYYHILGGTHDKFEETKEQMKARGFGFGVLIKELANSMDGYQTARAQKRATLPESALRPSVPSPAIKDGGSGVA